MARTASVFTRVDPDIKEHAEQILTELGISMSNAIGLFLHQVVMQNGIPFEIKLPRRPLVYGELSKEELDEEIRKSFEEVEAGKVIPASEVDAHMKNRFGA